VKGTSQLIEVEGKETEEIDRTPASANSTIQCKAHGN